jgi:hypothetical protein
VVDFVVFVSNIMYELSCVWNLSLIGVDMIRVVFESYISSLGLLYDEGAPHIVTYAKRSWWHVSMPKAGMCCVINGGVFVVMARRVVNSPNWINTFQRRHPVL